MDGLQSLYTNSSFKLRPIKFVPAKRPDNAVFPEGIEIVHLTPFPESQEKDMPRTAQVPPETSSSATVELFSEKDVKREWSAVCRVGAGLQNLGNTCFMNSVLQCLTHTPPLAEGLLHTQLSGVGGLSMLHMTQEHIRKALQGKQPVVAPVHHYRSMRKICRSFRIGRQEDAHEYLIGLLDAMHEGQLEGLKPKPVQSIQETSMIFRIFAGRIRSQVKCIECGFESNTVDPFLDISLEINQACTLEKALQRFTATEYLEGENKYKCPRQSCLVRAAKRIAIERAPNVLVIQLKRFEFSMYGQKIAKKVEFDTTLDMAPYMSDRRSGPKVFQLYGVLVHQGHSVHSGHYFCYVRAANGLWHQMNDNYVSQVSERTVLAQKAYILFYIKKDEDPAVPVSPRGLFRPQQLRNRFPNEQIPAKRPVLFQTTKKDTAAAISLQPRQAKPSPTAKRKRVEETHNEEPLLNGFQAPEAAQKPAAYAQDGEDAQAPRVDTLTKVPNGGIDPEVLRNRLQSHAEASPSTESFKSAVEVPSSPGSTENRYPSARLKAAWSPDKRSVQISDGKMSKLRSASANSTPSVAGSPGLRGTSPVTASDLEGNPSVAMNSKPYRFANSAGPPEDGFPPAQLQAGVGKASEVRRGFKIEMNAGAIKKPSINGHMSAEDSQQLSQGVIADRVEEGPVFADNLPQSKELVGKANGPTAQQCNTSGSKNSEAAARISEAAGKRSKLPLSSCYSTEPNLVQDVLGLQAQKAAGPGGGEHWDSTPEAAKQDADTFLRGLEKPGPVIDDYDKEYDAGKTKKIKAGPRHSSVWSGGEGNRFQANFNTRFRGRGNSRSNGRSRGHSRRGWST